PPPEVQDSKSPFSNPSLSSSHCRCLSIERLPPSVCVTTALSSYRTLNHIIPPSLTVAAATTGPSIHCHHPSVELGHPSNPCSLLPRAFGASPALFIFSPSSSSSRYRQIGIFRHSRVCRRHLRRFSETPFRRSLKSPLVRLILSVIHAYLSSPTRRREKSLTRDSSNNNQRGVGDFSPCLSPRFDSKEHYDFILVIDLQERRLKNLQLPDFKNIRIHHHGQVSIAGLSSQNNIKRDLT
ncbi:hypothetical protein S83_038859, partial [Arachis hypogaea]